MDVETFNKDTFHTVFHKEQVIIHVVCVSEECSWRVGQKREALYFTVLFPMHIILIKSNYNNWETCRYEP